MKKCNSCGININTNYDYCPFCQDKLVGESFSYYPKYKRKKMPSIFKIIVFISLIAGIITGFIDYNINATFTWSIYCFLGLLSNIIINFSIFHSEKDIHNSIIGYSLVLILIALIWYFKTKFNIISNLIIPIICIFIMLYTCCMSFFTKIKPLSYLSINILVILIPILLVLRHYTTNNILSYLAILIFIIIFIALYFFRHDELREELIKIFRI